VSSADPKLSFQKTHNDMVTSCLSQHVGNQLGRNRGSTLILLVLSCVHEVRDDSGDPSCRGDLAGVDHDAELHQGGVDFAGTLKHCGAVSARVGWFVTQKSLTVFRI
jgi:hypothetical protein